jgi:hypothetical protein
MILSEYGFTVSSSVAIFSSGKRIIGRSATTGMGKTSRTHQRIIRAATASVLQEASETPSGLMNKRSRKTAAPMRREIILLLLFSMVGFTNAQKKITGSLVQR